MFFHNRAICLHMIHRVYCLLMIAIYWSIYYLYAISLCLSWQSVQHHPRYCAWWTSCNRCTAPLLISVICKMPQWSNDSHHPSHPSIIKIQSLASQILRVTFGWTDRGSIHTFSPDFIAGDNYKVALISFKVVAYCMSAHINYCWVSLRNILLFFLFFFFLAFTWIIIMRSNGSINKWNVNPQWVTWSLKMPASCVKKTNTQQHSACSFEVPNHRCCVKVIYSSLSFLLHKKKRRGSILSFIWQMCCLVTETLQRSRFKVRWNQQRWNLEK